MSVADRDRKTFLATEEEAAYLKSKGWTVYEHPRPSNGSVEGVDAVANSIPMWTPPEGEGGMSFSLAWANQHSRDANAARRDALAKGVDLPCNKCGVNLKVTHENAHGEELFMGHYGLVDAQAGSIYHGLVNATLTTGYFSTHLPDTHRYIFSLCEKCLKELFDTFNIPPASEFAP